MLWTAQAASRPMWHVALTMQAFSRQHRAQSLSEGIDEEKAAKPARTPLENYLNWTAIDMGDMASRGSMKVVKATKVAGTVS